MYARGVPSVRENLEDKSDCAGNAAYDERGRENSLRHLEDRRRIISEECNILKRDPRQIGEDDAAPNLPDERGAGAKLGGEPLKKELDTDHRTPANGEEQTGHRQPGCETYDQFLRPDDRAVRGVAQYGIGEYHGCNGDKYRHAYKFRQPIDRAID